MPGWIGSLRRMGLAAAVVASAGCTMVGGNAGAEDIAPAPTAQLSTSGAMPPMRWNHRPEAPAWTETTLTALNSHGADLAAVTPRDIEAWCPGYPEADLETRQLFWAGLLSTLAKHESTWNPRAVGGGGKWFGLVQIAPSTARLYGCQARSGDALKDGRANLSCAVRIMARTVARDQVVSAGMRGVAADWGPFHSARKREDMKAWVSSQPYCQAPKPKGPLALLKRAR